MKVVDSPEEINYLFNNYGCVPILVSRCRALLS